MNSTEAKKVKDDEGDQIGIQHNKAAENAEWQNRGINHSNNARERWKKQGYRPEKHQPLVILAYDD